MVAICSAEPNGLCYFGRGHYEEHFCEIILNFGQWLRRCHLSIYFVQLSGRVCAILVEGFMGDIHVKLF